MSSVTFKVSYTNPESKEKEFRRFQLDVLRVENLRERVSSLFALTPNSWRLCWTDEDGDPITLTEQSELEHAVAATTGVVRLEVRPTATKPKPSSARESPKPFPVDRVADELLRGISSFVTETFPRQANPPTRAPRRGQIAVGLCDNTDIRLVSGSGDWFHLPGTTFDLCRAEWSKLPEHTKTMYVEVQTPTSLGAEMSKYMSPPGRFHPCQRSCRSTSQRSRVPPPPPQQAGMHSHVGWCDVTNNLLVPGGGWYHKRGANYDLSEAPYRNLTPREQKEFVLVNTASDLEADARRYAAQQYVPDGLKCLFDAFVEVPKGYKPAAPKPAPSPAPAEGTVEDVAEEEEEEPLATPADEANGLTEPLLANSSPPSDAIPEPLFKEQMEIVAGPSFDPNSTVEAGARLLPVWEVMNSSLEPHAMWTDVRVRPRSPNLLEVREEGFEVPMLEPGATGMVCVEFVVPQACEGQKFKAQFDLYNKEGETFGEPLEIELDVKSPEEAKRAEMLQSLRDMGFSDIRAAHEALAHSNGDLSDAVTWLLRQ